jgi:hypothetical protein
MQAPFSLAIYCSGWECTILNSAAVMIRGCSAPLQYIGHAQDAGRIDLSVSMICLDWLVRYIRYGYGDPEECIEDIPIWIKRFGWTKSRMKDD